MVGGEPIPEHALEEGGRQPVPPFVTWAESSAGACQGGWSLDGKELALTAPARARCVRASAAPVWTAHLLEPPPGREPGHAAPSDRVPGPVLLVLLVGLDQVMDRVRPRLRQSVSVGEDRQAAEDADHRHDDHQFDQGETGALALRPG